MLDNRWVVDGVGFTPELSSASDSTAAHLDVGEHLDVSEFLPVLPPEDTWARWCRSLMLRDRWAQRNSLSLFLSISGRHIASRLSCAHCPAVGHTIDDCPVRADELRGRSSSALVLGSVFGFCVPNEEYQKHSDEFETVSDGLIRYEMHRGNELRMHRFDLFIAS